MLALWSLHNLSWNFEVLWAENVLNLKDVSAFLKITLRKDNEPTNQNCPPFDLVIQALVPVLQNKNENLKSRDCWPR